MMTLLCACDLVDSKTSIILTEDFVQPVAVADIAPDPVRRPTDTRVRNTYVDRTLHDSTMCVDP